MDGETGGDTAHPTDSINGDGPQILSGSLTVVHGGSRGVRVEVPVAGLSLGRKRHASTSDGASLVLDDKVVSRRHAVIEHGAAGWVLRDTESQNAGAVDGVPYEKGATVRLKDGSVLRLGDTLLVFREAMRLPSRADLGAAFTEAFPGCSPQAERVRRDLAHIARSTGPVLILGETGTGKEYAARALHHGATPFVPVNCGLLGKELVASELFGHMRNAFTGAMTSRTGLVETASGGILFLDEIGELPLDVQPALLRFIEDGRFRPVGGTDLRHSSARLVAATHVNLEEAVRGGTFRADLLARLTTATPPLVLPPLRERREDVLLWAERFWQEVIPTATAASWKTSAAESLLLYPWPWNLRDLRGVMGTAARNALERGISLERQLLPERVLNSDHRSLPPREAKPAGGFGRPEPKAKLPRRTDVPSKEEVEATLRASHLHNRQNPNRPNIRKAAEVLGVNRRKVYRLIEFYDLKYWLSPKSGLADAAPAGDASVDDDSDDSDDSDDRDDSDDSDDRDDSDDSDDSG